jgi:hypothetical protein
MPDGRHSLLLPTAILMRGDGRPLLRPDTEDMPSFGFGRIAVTPPRDADQGTADKARPIPWGVTPDVIVETPGRLEDRGPDEFTSGRVVQAAVSRLRQSIRERGAVHE